MGALTAKLYRRDGSAGLVTVAKQDKENFKRLKKKDWGDEF